MGESVPGGSEMKVAVLGAGGIIGQHLMVTVPKGIEPTFTRTSPPSHLYDQLDVTSLNAADWINRVNPDIIVNLVGECRPDVVERDPNKYWEVNCGCTANMASWCDDYGKLLIHVSSQAVLGPLTETNEYGRQKAEVDKMLLEVSQNFVIVRPTFTLGIRPFPGIGRENPAERMLAGKETQSVDNRYFSIAFAWDVAECIWKLCQGPVEKKKIYYVGNPDRVSRYDLALLLASNKDITPVKHEDLPGLAPRPLDTSEPYRVGAYHTAPLSSGLIRLRAEWGSRNADDLYYRAREIAAFLRIHTDVVSKLSLGFAHLHGEVAADFRKSNPRDDPNALTEWYRNTEEYIWELTAYHCHPGFNYSGMCKGIIDRLKADGKHQVLCLGDGVGTMTIAMKDAGLTPFYHDLLGSKTAQFAYSRFDMRFGGVDHEGWLTDSFDPVRADGEFDAIVSADFLEHVPNVEEWVRAIYTGLKPGGLFFAQNAFNCGSGPEGSIPMHLTVNDHWEKDWDPLLALTGFVQESSNWYRKPE